MAAPLHISEAATRMIKIFVRPLIILITVVITLVALTSIGVNKSFRNLINNDTLNDSFYNSMDQGQLDLYLKLHMFPLISIAVLEGLILLELVYILIGKLGVKPQFFKNIKIYGFLISLQVIAAFIVFASLTPLTLGVLPNHPNDPGLSGFTQMLMVFNIVISLATLFLNKPNNCSAAPLNDIQTAPVEDAPDGSNAKTQNGIAKDDQKQLSPSLEDIQAKRQALKSVTSGFASFEVPDSRLHMFDTNTPDGQIANNDVFEATDKCALVANEEDNKIELLGKTNTAEGPQSPAKISTHTCQSYKSDRIENIVEVQKDKIFDSLEGSENPKGQLNLDVAGRLSSTDNRSFNTRLLSMAKSDVANSARKPPETKDTNKEESLPIIEVDSVDSSVFFQVDQAGRSVPSLPAPELEVSDRNDASKSNNMQEDQQDSDDVFNNESVVI